MTAPAARPPPRWWARAFSSARAVALTSLLLAGHPGAARANQGESADVEAERLVHMLGYLAWDYRVAVSNGAVVSQVEYGEQLSMLADAAAIAARIQPATETDLAGGVASLRSLFEARVAAADVTAAAVALRERVARAFQLAEAPLALPDRARGAALYAEHCATCHGAAGRADTARASTLTPSPADFHDPAIAEPLSPARVESALRFGVNGTAMVPFSFLSEDERWDLAFHVVGLRHAGAQAAPGAPIYSAVALAIRSDEDLRSELLAAGIEADRRAAIVADLRLRAPYVPASTPDPLTAARAALERARAAVHAGDPERARADLVSADLDGTGLVEPALRALDRALAAALHERFFAARAALEAGAPPDEVDDRIATLLRTTTYAQVALAGAGGARSALVAAAQPGKVPAIGVAPAALAVASASLLAGEAAVAALPVAALVAAAPPGRRRPLHAAWIAAALLAALAWVAASVVGPRPGAGGAGRALLIGASAVLGAAVIAISSALARPAESPSGPRRRSAASPPLAASAWLAALGAFFAAFGASIAALSASLGGALPVPAPLLLGALSAAILVLAVAATLARAARMLGARTLLGLTFLLCLPLAARGVTALQSAGLVPIHPLLRLP